jgi:integrase
MGPERHPPGDPGRSEGGKKGGKNTRLSAPEKKKKRRAKSPHPGVRIHRSKSKWTATDRRTGEPVEKVKLRWTLRWQDPATGKVREEDVTKFSRDQRVVKAKIKSAELEEERRAFRAKGLKPTRTPLAEAVESYIEERDPELSEATMRTYRLAADEFLAWAEDYGPEVVEKLTAKDMRSLRKFVVSRPLSRQLKGGAKGERTPAKRKRAPKSLNQLLTSLGTMLTNWRKVGLLPRLDSDAIRDGLEKVRLTRPVPSFLRAPALQKLLRTALRHDRETYRLTRAEKAGEAEPGTTPRNEPIAPFIVTVLLTGMRLGEAIGLRWDEVYLEDDGEIVLDAERTKTSAGRRIGLAESPAVREILAALRLRSGGGERVFEPLTREAVNAARRRLMRAGSGSWTWQELRRTCGPSRRARRASSARRLCSSARSVSGTPSSSPNGTTSGPSWGSPRRRRRLRRPWGLRIWQ